MGPRRGEPDTCCLLDGRVLAGAEPGHGCHLPCVCGCFRVHLQMTVWPERLANTSVTTHSDLPPLALLLITGPPLPPPETTLVMVSQEARSLIKRKRPVPTSYGADTASLLRKPFLPKVKQDLIRLKNKITPTVHKLPAQLPPRTRRPWGGRRGRDDVILPPPVPLNLVRERSATWRRTAF